MTFALDSSVAVAWYFPDEGNVATDAVLRRVAVSGAIVPVHWRAEVANAFRMAVRRKRIDDDYCENSLKTLSRLDIVIDAETNSHMWDATMSLARRHGLTVYDAAYLKLAQRRKLNLASLDQALCSAAAAEGVPTLNLIV